jgi:uncharacterized protein YeaO (DUF488 family)
LVRFARDRQRHDMAHVCVNHHDLGGQTARQMRLYYGLVIKNAPTHTETGDEPEGSRLHVTVHALLQVEQSGYSCLSKLYVIPQNDVRPPAPGIVGVFGHAAIRPQCRAWSKMRKVPTLSLNQRRSPNTMRTFAIKRAYADAGEEDGYRILVDRLWPRGRTKEQMALAQWNKDWAPTPALRTWFDHRPDRFAEFTRRYKSEMAANLALKDELRALPRKHITLVYGARDPEINHAVVLAAYLKLHSK